jgi:mono/diheme cytochrome c family protein
MKFFLLGCITILALSAAGVCVFVYLGLLDLRADQSPSGFERKYAMAALDASTKRRAPELAHPIQTTDANLLEGMKLYETNCALCHGDPSIPQPVVGSSLYPAAPRFTEDPPDMPDNQNFYIIKYGIRWTGMPAWRNLFSDDQIGKLTAFCSQMGKLPPSVDQEWKKGKSSAKSGNGN